MYRHRRLLITLTGLGAASAPVLGMSTTSSAAPPSPAPRVTVLHLSGQAAQDTRGRCADAATCRQRLCARHAGGGIGSAGHRVRARGVGRGAHRDAIARRQNGIGRAVHPDSRRQGARRRPDGEGRGLRRQWPFRRRRGDGRRDPLRAGRGGVRRHGPGLGAHEGRCAGRPGRDGRTERRPGGGVAAPGGWPGGAVGYIATGEPGGAGSRSRPASSRREAAPTPYDSACARHLLQRQQYSHACDIRYLDYARNGQWYLSHKMKVSAAYDSFWSALTSANVYVVYGSGGTGNGGKGTMWADFDPYTTESVGRCGTWTAGVQDPKTGANIAYSGTICPSSIGPVWTARAQRTYKGYGATWRGRSSSAKGAVAAGVVNNPSGSTASRSVQHPLQLVPEVATSFAGREPAAPVQGLGARPAGGPAERGPPMPFRWPRGRAYAAPHGRAARDRAVRRHRRPGPAQAAAGPAAPVPGRAAAARAASSARRSRTTTTSRSARSPATAVRRVREPPAHRRRSGTRSRPCCATCPAAAAPAGLRHAVEEAEAELGGEPRRLHYLSVPPKAALAVVHAARRGRSWSSAVADRHGEAVRHRPGVGARR